MLLSGERQERSLGSRGEDIAAEYLRRQGLVVLSRNWRSKEGELDLVATDGHRVVVAEVKTRSGTAFGAPADAVTPAKARRIRRLTGAWLARYRVGACEVRFDVLSVLWRPQARPLVQHIRDAF